MQKSEAMSGHGSGSSPKGEGPSGYEENWPSVGSDRKIGSTEEDEMFSDLHSKLWRSPSWGSLSAPSSPRYVHTTTDDKSTHRNVPFPLTPHPQQSPRQRPAMACGSSDERRDWAPPTPRRREISRIKNGLDIKLDLGAVQRSRDAAEPTEMQLKRDKFAFFDKDCSHVAEHIFIGGDAVARNRKTLLASRITHVLNCVGFVCPECFPDDFKYKTLWLHDSPCEDITSILYDVFDYFEEVREVGGRVFVHCCQGVSRSTSLVIAYLMWRKGRSFEDAFQDVKAARGVTNPNMGFACQLLQCQKRVHAVPVSPNSMLRMYRIAPHSPYDPLHLVPKVVMNPGAAAFDSRGAFVVHVPSDIFVWVGKFCDTGMASAAKTAASQVVKYERAQGKISFIGEGDEPAKFWNELNKGCASAEGSDSNSIDLAIQQSAGNNKLGAIPGVLCCHTKNLQQLHLCEEVDCSTRNVQEAASARSCESAMDLLIVRDYDVDYEIYCRALKGVVPPSNGLATHVPARDSVWGRLRRQVFSGSVKDFLASEASNYESSSQSSRSIDLKLSEDILEATSSHSAPQGARTLADPGLVEGPSTSMGPSVCTPPSPSVSTASTSSPPFTQSDTSTESSSYTGYPSFELSSNETTITTRENTTKNQTFVCLPAFSFSFSTPLQTDHYPNQLNSNPPFKAPPPLSLAQRRGSTPPSLRLPTLVDDPSTPKGPLESQSLPSLPSTETPKNALFLNGNGSLHFVKELPNFLGSMLDDRANTIKSRCDFDLIKGGVHDVSKSALSEEVTTTESKGSVTHTSRAGQVQRQPEMYAWPSMEKVGLFDAGNLDSQAAFVLVAPTGKHSKNMTEGDIRVYVWVGKNMKEMEDIDNQQSIWEKLGEVISEGSQLQVNGLVTVVMEGAEPDEFWELFING